MNLLFNANSIFIDRPILFLNLSGPSLISNIKLKNTPGFPLSALPVGTIFTRFSTVTNSFGVRAIRWVNSNFGPGLSTINVENLNGTLPWNIPPDVRFYVNNSSPTNTFYTNTSTLTLSAYPLTGWVSTNSAYDPPPEFEIFSRLADSVTLNGTGSASVNFLFDNPNLFRESVPLISFTITTTGLNIFNIVRTVSLTNPFITYIDVTQFKNLSSFNSSISLNSLSSLNLLSNTELATFNFNTVPNLEELNLNNNKKLNFFALNTNKINLNSVLTATSGLFFLNFSNNSVNPDLNTQLDFSSEQLLNICSVTSLTGYSLFNFTNLPFLSSLSVNATIRRNLSSSPAIYNFNNLPYIRSVSMSNMPELSSSHIDSLYNSLCSSINLGSPSAGSASFSYSDYPSMSGRSASSNSSLYNLLRRGYTNITSTQVDPVQPISISPQSYVPSTIDSMTVVNTVSATTVNGVLSTLTHIPHFQLSGRYIKTGSVFNGRDVFRNENNYFLLFNNTLNSWTIVGPSSSSNFIWLSSFYGFQGQSYGDWGNPPVWRWRGPAYALGRFLQSNNAWYQPTAVFKTDCLLFSSLRFDSNVFTNNSFDTTPRVLSGFNSPDKFLFSDYDFTGVTYFGNTKDPWLYSGRGAMISPIHLLFAFHYPPGWGNNSLPNNNITSVFSKNNQHTALTVVTGRRIGSTDLAIGIISPSTPYTGTFYPLLSGTTTTLSGNFDNFYFGPGSFRRFLYGPTKAGRIGYGYPQVNFRSTSSNRVTYASTVSTIPNSDWNVMETATIGDSSSHHWMVSGKNLILTGVTQFSNNTGPSYIPYYDNIVQACTALNLHIYGPGNEFIHIPKGLVFDKNLIQEGASQLSPRLGTYFESNYPQPLGMRTVPRFYSEKNGAMAKMSKSSPSNLVPVRTNKGFDLPFYSSYPGDVSRPSPYSELSVATIRNQTTLSGAGGLRLQPRYGLTKFNYQIRNKTLHSLTAVSCYGDFQTGTINLSANYVDCVQKLIPFIEEKLAKKTGVPENYDTEAIVNWSRWCEVKREFYGYPDPRTYSLEIPVTLINPNANYYTALSTSNTTYQTYLELGSYQEAVKGFGLRIISSGTRISVLKNRINNRVFTSWTQQPDSGWVVNFSSGGDYNAPKTLNPNAVIEYIAGSQRRVHGPVTIFHEGPGVASLTKYRITLV